MLGSRLALPGLRNGSLGWRPEFQTAAESLRQSLSAVDPAQFDQALDAEARRRAGEFLTGVEAYRRHPYHRDMPAPPVAWSQGSTRLLDYSLPGATGPAVLMVPSLINRAYILDLSPRRSVMRYLADKGLRPFLVDWDAPGPEEKGFGLTDYIAGRLAGALDAVLARAGKPVLAGYCMGGILALGLGILRQADVSGLALLATPWDFHAPDPQQGRLLASMRPMLDDVITAHGEMPLDLLQILFSTIDPRGCERKFRAFSRLKPRCAKARDFVALEDWLNDGVSLAGPVAREALFNWYVDDETAQNRWCLGGSMIRPQDFAKPSLALIPNKDRIVPPASSLALAQALPHCRIRLLPAGHIGMVTGGRAKTEVYGPLTKWIRRVGGCG